MGEKIEIHLSECCSARLLRYDKSWRDGVCSECEHHSPELDLELEEV